VFVALRGNVSRSYGALRAIWDQSVTRHRWTHLPSQTGRYSIYLPRWDGRL